MCLRCASFCSLFCIWKSSSCNDSLLLHKEYDRYLGRFSNLLLHKTLGRLRPLLRLFKRYSSPNFHWILIRRWEHVNQLDFIAMTQKRVTTLILIARGYIPRSVQVKQALKFTDIRHSRRQHLRKLSSLN